MKVFTMLLMILFSISSGFSQNSPIDFEQGGFGADWSWTVFENDSNPSLDIIDNPDPSGINTSAKVARFTALQAGNPWAGCESMEGNLGSFLWDENNRILKIMVWKSVISDVGIKFDAGAPPNDWAQAEIKVANTLINQWEELTFDFSAALNPPDEFGGLKRIIIFPDFDLGGRTQDNVIYIDNITFHPSDGGGGGDEPLTAAPTPMRNAADVISLYSDAYTDVPVDTWRTDWSAAVLEDIEIQGNPTKKYTNLDFVGIETVSNQIDITGMTHFHVDVWSPNFEWLRLVLVDFGPDGAFGGGDDTEGALEIEMPATAQWVSLDIPLSSFPGLMNRENFAQLIFAARPSGGATLYVDNVYFYTSDGGGGGDEPLTAAPTPTRNAADVISLYSDAYTDVPVDTWRTDWSSAVLEDIEIQGNPTKKYTNLDFVGIETVSNQIDITGMTHFHVDVWSPNFEFFRVVLVDFGPDGAFGGGDDTEGILDIEMPATGQWVSLDIPLSSLPSLMNRRNFAQLIFAARPSGGATLYVDNVYFYTEGGGGGDEPLTAAPTPTRNAADVISMYSDAYTDVPVDTWRTDWSSAVLEDIEIQGNPTKKYTNLDFVGIETVSNQIDITGMTHFHVDVWSPNFEFFRVVLVDFGPDGAFGGGDDTEGILDIEMPATAQWVSLDIPLSSFPSLMNRRNFSQLIFAARPTGGATVYVDNVYFYTEGGGGGDEPLTAAPTPTRNAADVISMYSDAYTDVPVDTWRTDWSSAVLEDIEIQGNPTKKYTNLDFVGIETVSNQIDITGMTHFHVDVWSPNFEFFRVVLVDFGPDGAFGGGDDTEGILDIEMPATGQWVSLDIPLSSLPSLMNRRNFAQLIFAARPVGGATVYVDNVYFYNDMVNVLDNAGNSGKMVRVYPNPVSTGNIIQLSEEVKQIEIFDVSGRLLNKYSNNLQSAQLQPGLYILKIETKEGVIQTQKIVVN